jgi:hypothetical protein
MTTLETLLKQVEELDALKKGWATKDSEVGAHRMLTQGMLAGAAPILVEVIRKLVEQSHQLIVEYVVSENVDGDFSFSEQQEEVTARTQELFADLDAIVAKASEAKRKGEE